MSNKTAESLKGLLADHEVLYQKLRNYHWNITGEKFFELHVLFETQYTAMAVRIDDIAERLRYLGEIAPGSYAAFLKLSNLKEDPGVPPSRQMVENLLADYMTLSESVKACRADAEAANDLGTVVMLEDYVTMDQKTIWMMRSFLA